LEILLAEDKTTIMFLGLEIDTVLMLVRIPEDKLIPVFLNLSFLQRLYVKMLQFFSKIAQDREHPISSIINISTEKELIHIDMVDHT
jgi:hypothetical protein